jgi:hypothetical protein
MSGRIDKANINFMDAIIETLDYIECATEDTASTKQDVLDEMRDRMSILVARITSHNYSSSMSFNGWSIAE